MDTEKRVGEAMAELPPELFEQTYVHTVYNKIATHFSDTRYKPWPAVESFLNSLEPGSLGADIGCGNGKYLGVNKQNVLTIGCDRSDQLIRICGERGHQALVCDGLSVPIRTGSMDFAISIAVIHHFSSRDRRLAAVRECLRVVKPQNGTVFIQVWALEQQQGSKRNFTEQDNFVSWKLPVARYGGAKKANTAEEKPEPPKENEENVVYNRYYHLFKKGELDELVLECGGEILQSDYEKDNHFVICRPGKSQTIE